ncbi:MAG TPA: citrate/2-methylcitrate synthase [Mycobacterium sp.]
MPEFTTTVSEVLDGGVNLRGFSLEEIMRHRSYTDGAFLALIGRLPSAPERVVVNGVLSSLLDHGFVASTITAARYAASGNPQVVTSVAAGILAAGSNTLSPEDSYELLDTAATVRQDQGLDHDDAARVVVQRYKDAGRRVPGMGHPTHKVSDFRADVLYELADQQCLTGDAINQSRALQRAVVELTGRKLPLNIDGALAAVGMDLGWSSNQTVCFALLSVLPGLMGHVIEEIDQGRPLRYITDGEYTGAALSPLPAE